MAQYRPEREKRPPCPVPAILPVFPYPGDVLEPIRVYHYILLMFTSHKFVTDCLLVKLTDKTILKIHNLSQNIRLENHRLYLQE